MLVLKDLFTQYSTGESKRLYSLYLSTLMSHSRERRVFEVCQRIQRFAIRHKDATLGDFTYGFAIEALCKLGDFRGAWRQLRRLEKLAFGKNIDLKSQSWTSDELNWFSQYHPQILYLIGKYTSARRLLEAALSKRMGHHRKGLSYDLLPLVCNSIKHPRQRHEVTLLHVYQKLGRNLNEWRQWEAFVNGFDSRLFQLSRVSRHDLLSDASLLPHFVNSIADEKAKRLTAGVSMGEEELTGTSERVKKYQAIVNRRKNRKAVYAASASKQLEEIFPDLRGLLR